MPFLARPKILEFETIEGDPIEALNNEPHCGHCGKVVKQHVMTLVQYGFVADTMTEVYRCKSCGKHTSFKYDLIVTITPDGIKATEDITVAKKWYRRHGKNDIQA